MIVVYIAAALRSGSTLLDHLLGNNANMECVGELWHLNDYINRRGVGRTINWLCTCKKPVVKCPFWTKIGTSFEQKEHEKFGEYPTRVCRIHHSYLKFLREMCEIKKERAT